MTRSLMLIVPSLLLTACTASPAPSSSEPMPTGTDRGQRGAWTSADWSLEKTCTLSCSDYYQTCETNHLNLMSACQTACISTGDCSACFSPDYCRCDEQLVCNFTFTNGSVRDEALFTSCSASWRRNAMCGLTSADPVAVCDGFARAERTEVAAAYDCFSDLSCGSDSSGCAPASDHERLDDAFCARLDGTAFSCSSSLRGALSGESDWSSDVSVAALHLCDAQTSDSEYAKCLRAWVVTVYGPLAQGLDR